MQIKGASQRILDAAKTLWENDTRTQTRVQGSEKPQPSLSRPVTAQDTVIMLATPRNSIASAHDDDMDELIAEGRAAADALANTQAVAARASSSQVASSEALELAKSVDEDIEEWLLLTGFYDEAYHQTTLTRHRRLKAIEQEKQQLLREEQELLQEPPLGLEPVSTASPTTESIPGPLPAVKQERASYSPPPASAVLVSASRRKQKRSHDEMAEPRTSIDENRAKIVRRRSLELFPSKSKKTSPRRPAQTSREGAMQYNSTDIPQRSARSDLFMDYNSPLRAQQAPDTRYFHIRSWNYDNVVAAQRDNVWVTQKSNEATLVEAFTKSRRVVLFFSVNHSQAFQGIAEMVSIPGKLGKSRRPI
jgi:hypothetical protein